MAENADSVVRSCRLCGCTDERACPGGCWWVDGDLCSTCAVAPPAADPVNREPDPRFVAAIRAALDTVPIAVVEVGGLGDVADVVARAAWDWLMTDPDDAGDRPCTWPIDESTFGGLCGAQAVDFDTKTGEPLCDKHVAELRGWRRA